MNRRDFMGTSMGTCLAASGIAGKLVGADGWEGDKLGCSVEARVVPIEGRAEDFARKQTDYGNHLIWVYGHYADELEQLGEMLDMKVEVVG